MLRALLVCMAAHLLVAAVLSADNEKRINYVDDIKPILRQHCLKCHGNDRQEADINLQTYAALMRGGSGGKIVEAGRASQSVLFQAITHPDDDGRMPPNSPPLPGMKVELIRRWIDSGLRHTADSKAIGKARNLKFMPSGRAGAKPAGPPAMPGKLPMVTVKGTRRSFPVLAMDASLWAPLLAVSAWEHVRLFDTEKKQEIGRLAFPEGEPHVIRFSRDGAVLLVAGGRPVDSGRVVLFDVRSGKRLAEIGDELDTVLAADLSPDQRQVAFGGSGRVVKVYSTTDGALKYKLTKHTEWITAVAFSPDGMRLATSDRAGGLHLWDTRTGGITLTLAEHKAAVRALDWRADSRLLASVGEDGRIVWWNAADGFPVINKSNAHPPVRPPGTFRKLPNGVLAARFDRKGNLVTSGRDQRVRVWAPNGGQRKVIEIKTGMPISTSISHRSGIISGDSSGGVSFYASP